MTVSWVAAGASDVGRVRAGNEDAFRMDPDRGVFLVADGMGGHAAGEVASALAAETVADRVAEVLDSGVADGALPDSLRAAVLEAHARIERHGREQPRARGMGTTLTACVLRPDGTCHVVHIGDSRLYRFRAGLLEQLTHDHTWVQREVDAGRLSPAAAKRHHLSHILTRVLTDDAPPEVDLLSGRVEPGDLLLLATDGLYNMLDDAEIGGALASDLPLPRRVQALVEAANRAGGHDNVTVVLVGVGGPE